MCSIIDTSDRSIQDILSKLKFIAQIKEAEIIDVGSMSVQTISWFTSLYRTTLARGESRESALKFFRTTIQDAFDLVKEELSLYEFGGISHNGPSSNKVSPNKERTSGISMDTALSIIGAIEAAKQGIICHGNTYVKLDNDRMHHAKIETLIEMIDTNLKALRSTLDGLVHKY